MAERKHTVLNAEETGWFVWNMATYDLRDAVNLSAIEWPADEDEFARAGVTPVASINAPCPRVKESPAHFECRIPIHASVAGKFKSWLG
jgi:flavin reductase (DIM6/NTAB) family NADH-FMN oxidoreductase RutF